MGFLYPIVLFDEQVLCVFNGSPHLLSFLWMTLNKAKDNE